MTTTVSVDDDVDAGGGVPSPMGNIRQLAWVPIIDGSGRRLVGLDELFTHAHLIERIDVRAPIEKAGVLRFLTTVTALIARAQGIMPQTAEGVARDGFDPAAVTSVLDSIDDRLWLIHPSTPFMQEGRFRTATSSVKTAASIRSTSPGDSSKAWWGRRCRGSWPPSSPQLLPATQLCFLRSGWAEAWSLLERISARPFVGESRPLPRTLRR